MVKITCGIFLLFIGCSLVQGQSATINDTLKEINNFESSTVAGLSRSYNNLRDDVYGHFLRSQNTLRIARQNLFSIASKFPFYQLTNTTRANLVSRLTSIINECIDPTVDFIQKQAILGFYNFQEDGHTQIETAWKGAHDQIQNLTEVVKAVTDDQCLDNENVSNRRLGIDFNPLTTAINDCTKNASGLYREPISNFTRAHFLALPLINRMSTDLSFCANGNKQEDCVTKFLLRYCEETCKVCPTITAVSDAADSMTTLVTPKYEECLISAAKKLLSVTPYEKIRKCVKDNNSTNSV